LEEGPCLLFVKLDEFEVLLGKPLAHLSYQVDLLPAAAATIALPSEQGREVIQMRCQWT